MKTKYQNLIKKMRSLSADFDLVLEEELELPQSLEMNLVDISTDLTWMADDLEKFEKEKEKDKEWECEK